MPPVASEPGPVAGQTLQFPRGALITQAGQSADTLYLLRSGVVRLYVLQGPREITLGVHERALLGGAALLGEGARHCVYAQALSEVQVSALPAAALRAAGHPELLELLAAQLRQTQQRLGAQVFLEVSQRLALTLLELAGDPGGDPGGPLAIEGRVSHQDLAHRVGSTRETITKLLGMFRDRGLLDLGYRRIAVLDLPGLRAAAREPLR